MTECFVPWGVVHTCIIHSSPPPVWSCLSWDPFPWSLPARDGGSPRPCTCQGGHRHHHHCPSRGSSTGEGGQTLCPPLFEWALHSSWGLWACQPPLPYLTSIQICKKRAAQNPPFYQPTNTGGLWEHDLLLCQIYSTVPGLPSCIPLQDAATARCIQRGGACGNHCTPTLLYNRDWKKKAQTLIQSHS